MDNGIIASRYAKALLGYALEKKQEDRLYEEMKMLTGSFISHPRLQEVINNPTVLAKDKKKVITTAGGIETSEVFQSFVEMLITNRREYFCYVIALKYQDFYRKKKNMTIGTLTSTNPVHEETERKLKEIIKSTTGNDVDFKTVTDPSLIGGFILDVDHTRLDASISHQLNVIKKQLLRS